jgi:glucosamine--fructose-6-phosphate aminotransferase (isomerizing)
MCGIVGYLGSDIFIEFILSGLKLLQNRGYDSVGICSILNGELETLKYASTNTHNSLERLEEEMNVLELYKNSCIKNDQHNKNQNLSVAIGHTRWATHGPKTDINAHPHNDNNDRISLVHNGIIENYAELKLKLINEGFTFRSQTDTEIIAVLIGKYLDLGETMEQSINHAVEELTGTWALVIINRDYPNKMWITRNGSPLLLGMAEDYVMVVSEQIAFGNYINKYIVLNNNDLIEITKDNGKIKYNKNVQKYTIKDKRASLIELTPTKQNHWMLQEIMEQPESINRALNNGGRIESNVSVKLGGLDLCKSRLLDINHLVILGCGTSYNAGIWSQEIFKSLDIFDTVISYDGAEFNIRDIPKKGKTGLILLSQSGETKDLHRCIKIAKDYDLITVGVVNVVDSMIALETDCGVYLNAGREVAVASTKSFTNQCVVLVMIAIWFSQNRGTCIEKRRKIISDLRNLSFNMQNILIDTEHARIIATGIKDNTSIFLLGKGRDEAIAKEGALKLKEVSYIHAEGYSSSSLKHGAFALIIDNLPIILLDINEEYREKTQNVFHEVSARNAKIIRICDKQYAGSQLYNIIIEKNDTFGGLLANTYIQLISYYMALERGYNPDFPRNLAKVVTVE